MPAFAGPWGCKILFEGALPKPRILHPPAAQWVLAVWRNSQQRRVRVVGLPLVHPMGHQ